MKKIIFTLLSILTLCLPLFAGSFTNAYVNQVYLENESRFRITFSNSTTSYIVNTVDFSQYGADRFNQIHSLALAALTNNKLVDATFTTLTDGSNVISIIKIHN